MKRCGGYVSVLLLKPLLEALGRVGVEVEELLRDAHVDPALFGDPSSRVPLDRLQKFWEAVPLAAGDEAIGLRAADFVQVSSFDAHWYMAKCSATGRDALLRGQHYTPLLTNQYSLELSLEGDRAVVQYVHLYPVPRILSDLFIALSVRVGRELYSPRTYPLLEVRLSYLADPIVVEKYAAYFGVPVHFGCRYDGFVIPASVLGVRQQEADGPLCRILERQAERELRRYSSPSGFAIRVRRVLAAQLKSGDPSMELTGKQLGVSIRTLRRRLEDEGASHARILEGLRHRLALEYLDQGRTVGEAASLLCYRDTSAFSKAFKRWTGMSPAKRARERSASDREL